MALLRLLQEPPARITADAMILDGVDMQRAGRADLARVRGKVAAMIFQDPMTAFDPVFTIGHQITETIRAHQSLSKRAAWAEAEALLARVEIRRPAAVAASYPHQLSGGMLQRAMIAMALSCQPRLLVADEPTTALDVTVQAQILQLIKDLQSEFGMGLIMITHDLGVVAETVDRVIVMYGGQVMETAPVTEIFARPGHPYTRALLSSVPGQGGGRGQLTEIPGASPDPSDPPPGCPFHPRCAVVLPECVTVPPVHRPAPDHALSCWRAA